jgi:hypothetical protein
MADPVICKMPDCGGEIDLKKYVTLQTGCNSYSSFYPCDKCGRIHSSDGDLIFNRPGAAVYRREDGSIDLVMEPISFDPGKTYVTNGYLYIWPENEETDGSEASDPIELKVGTSLIFDNMDGETFCFHGEDGTGYRLHRGDVNSVKEVK